MENSIELLNSLQGIVSINMIHVSLCTSTIALFRESVKLLHKGQFLMLYGPFRIGNIHTSQSNYCFDNLLKMQNNLWGIRDLEAVSNEGKKMDFFNKR